MVATFRDIREQKRAQEALVWEAARLRAIVEAAPVGLGIVAADGEVLMRNDVLRNIWVGEAPVASVEEFAAYKAYWPETGEQLQSRGVAGGPSPQDRRVVRRRRRRHRPLRRHAGDDRALHRAHPGQRRHPGRGDHRRRTSRAFARPSRPCGSSRTRSATCTRRSCSTRWPSSTELACIVVAQAGLLLGSDGSSIFLLGGDGSLRRVAGVGVPDPEGIDDVIAQTIGDHAAVDAAVRAGGAGGRRDARQHHARRPPGDPRGGLRRDGLSPMRTGDRSRRTGSGSRARSPTRRLWRSRTRGSGRASRRRRSKRSAPASPGTCTTR